MVEHLFASFLKDPSQYAESVRHWLNVWYDTAAAARRRHGWVTPWLGTTEARGLGDGNPIFSAWSPSQRRGIRVIQYAPTRDAKELAWWLDTFAGPIHNPDCVEELVIACALSRESSVAAQDLMEQWVRGKGVSIESTAVPPSNPDYLSIVPFACHPESAAV